MILQNKLKVQFASMASLPNRILRRDFDTRPTPAGPSHDLSFLYGGPYSAFVKTMLILMLIDHFASINAPAMYLHAQFWTPIILFRINSAKEIIRVFIAVTIFFSKWEWTSEQGARGGSRLRLRCCTWGQRVPLLNARIHPQACVWEEATGNADSQPA